MKKLKNKNMKNLILLIITTITINGVIAQTTAINESFETWPATDWNIYQQGQGGNWLHSSLWGPNLGYNGGNCAKIQINNDPCDNWLVSPQVSVISNDYQLAFYEKSKDLQYYGYQGVYISTGSGNPNDNDFVAISESLQIEDTWVEHTVDLSAYNGDDIYIAFVYQGTWTHWDVDEVVISPSSFIDAALTEIVNPIGINPIPSVEDVIVTLHNYGTDPINDIDIEWHINGIQQTTYTGTGLNITPDEDVDIIIGQYNFAVQDDYIIQINQLLNGDTNPSNDSIESVYYVNNPKDVALTKIIPEGYSPNTGNKDVVVTVLNNGDFTFDDVIVEWDIDGVNQPDFQANSLNLEPGDEIDLAVGQFNFSTGLSEISCNVILSADEDLSNNSGISYFAVDIFWESFESSIFPPEMWSADDYPLKEYFFDPPHGEFYYMSQTDNNIFGEISDTLWTPLLNIESGDEITFMVNNSAYFTNNDNLIWKDGTTGAISVIQDIDSELEQWDQVTIDITSAAGINYIGFVNDNPGSFGQSSLDEITSDADIYLYNNDLGIKDFQFENTAKISEPHTFSVSMRNYGTTAVQASSYTVILMKENDMQLATQPGVTLQSWEETTIDITYTFTDIETYDVYAVIEYTADQSEKNNTSVTYPISSLPADIAIADVGFAEVENIMIPFDTGGDTWTLGSDDISQHIYYQDELNMEGYLYGITLHYHELFAVGQYLPLQISMKETELEDLSGGWIPAEELQLVFNDTINVFPGFNSVYIPFDEPVLITGTSNIAFQYYQYQPSWPSTACRFYSTNDPNGPVRTIRLNNLYNLDPDDLPNYWAEHTDYTYTQFSYTPIGSEGIVSGSVFDENNDTIQWVTITLEGTSIVENTGENGIYTLPALPYETYNITASFLGYSDLTQTIEINQQNETLDFYLEPLPQVAIFGEVFGSNAPDVPLEGVMVTIDGYEFSTTYTNENGEFIFENVYGDNDYTILFEHKGYYDFIDLIVVADEGVDLGSIIINENMISAYNIVATPGTDHVTIDWSSPTSSESVKLQNDKDIASYSYMNEPYEEVWLGNVFYNNDIITATSVEILWDIYEQAHDSVTIDILDMNGSLLVSSQPFITHHDSIMTIDIPNISIEGDFYAMVHWEDNPESTDPLTIDYSENVQNTAYIKYPGEAPVLFSDFTGGYNGSFFVRVNTLDEQTGKGNREVLSYNIYRGLVENIDEAHTWAALNNVPITDTIFIDETWSSNDPLEYTYAVEAIYVEGYANFTFSNFIAGFTSIGDNNIADDNVVIYPNPASATINLSGVEGSTIAIYNIMGEELFSAKIYTPKTKIDVSSYEDGAYFIRVNGLNVQSVKKLVIAN